MTVSVATLGDPLLALLAISCLTLVFYLVGVAWTENRASRKEHRARNRQRRAFWGYE
jgi:hypothetical protein